MLFLGLDGSGMDTPSQQAVDLELFCLARLFVWISFQVRAVSVVFMPCVLAMNYV